MRLARLHAVRKTVKKKDGEAFVITRLRAILEEDSDGDGVSNLLEILGGSNPGNPNSKLETAAIKRANQIWTAFQPYPPWPMFQTVRRPAVPQVRNTAWVRNPIDAFIAAEHEERGLKPRPEATEARPAAARLSRPDRPAADAGGAAGGAGRPSADWYEKVVDRLLASPHYGERWGRHWMDVWRYSDWAGYGAEVRDSQPHIWRWRDWIVESLNADKGYDRMIVEMLAGDELAPTDPQTLRATGFLVRNWFKFNRNVWLENTVEHTSKAFLGITMNCARCHDHLFDPISHEGLLPFPRVLRAVRCPHRPPARPTGLEEGTACRGRTTRSRTRRPTSSSAATRRTRTRQPDSARRAAGPGRPAA